MSTELNPLQSERNPEVSVTTFSGGTKRGGCLQLTQRNNDFFPHAVGHVQLTKEQVVEAMKVMTDWLANH